MKKPILFLAIVAALTFTSCSSDDDADNALTCEQAQANLEALGEDTDCEVTIQALEDVKEACGDDDGQIQATIEILGAFCSL